MQNVNPKRTESDLRLEKPVTPVLVQPHEIERYLQFYTDALTSCDGRLALFELPGAKTFASSDPQAVAKRAVKRAESQLDVYLHVHLHQLPDGTAPGTGSRGSIETARAAIGLFSDIDARGPGRKKPPETLCPTVDDAVWVVDEFASIYRPLRASLVIASGHGCYPVLLFKEPFIIEGEEDGTRLEALNRRFHAALHTIASGRGWTGAVDYCDPAKVLRLPGCVNFKDPTDPKLVHIAFENPARFNLSELEEVLPPLQGNTVAISARSRVITIPESSLSVNPDSEETSRLIPALMANHPLFSRTWNHERPDLPDQSCSGYDMAIAGICVASGFTDSQISGLLVRHRRKFPGKKQERRGPACVKYLQHTIAKAREGKETYEEAEQRWAEVSASVNTVARRTGEGGDAAPPADTPAGQPDHGDGDDDLGGQHGDGSESGSKTKSANDPNGGGCTLPAEFVLAQVRTTGMVDPVYEHIDVLARLPESELAIVYQQLKSSLGSKLNYHHFNRALKDTRARTNSRIAPGPELDPRPTIWTSDRLLDEIAGDAIKALEAANDPPVVFRRGGRLVMIHPDEDGMPIIMQATEAMMRGRLARVARFLKETRQGTIKVSPPQDLTLDVLTANEGTFPALGVLTQIPILRPDGSIRYEAGYDPITRSYYLPTPSFKLGMIPESPTPADAAAAAKFLDEAIGEFPFEGAADKANCIALMLTPILKVALKMKSPLALIDSPKWGTGKSLLAMVVYVLATGAEGTVCAAPSTEEEWRKRVTSILERGSAVVIIDNIDQTLRSPSLSAVLTSVCWEDRVLGKSEDVRLPNVSTWIATGNNICLSGEMARRSASGKIATPNGLRCK
jgi:hypothetical protein